MSSVSESRLPGLILLASDGDGRARQEAARRLLPHGADYAPLNRVASLAASLLSAPAAQVSMLTDVQTVVGGAGLAAGAVGAYGPLQDSLCAVTASLGSVLLVPDAVMEPRVNTLPPVTSGRVGAYLGVPLTADSGDIVGALCVFDPAPHAWTEHHTQVLEHLAEFVRAELELAAVARELDDSRARWELTVEAGDVGSFDRDLATGELAWDDRLMAIYAYGEDAAHIPTLASFRERLHPDDAPRVDAALAQAVDAVGPFHVDYRILLPGGRVRWLEARGRALADADGVASRLIGVVWDVTGDHETTARGDRVLASMSVGYLATDDQWRVTYVNEEGARLAGSTAADMLGRTLWDLFPRIDERAKAIYLRVAQTGEPGTHEGFYSPLDAWYEIRAVPENGGVSLYYLNVTERRRSLDLLQLSVDVSDQMVGAATIEAAVSPLATRLIPDMADWSIVTLVENGTVRNVRTWHRDPALRPTVERYAAFRQAGGGSAVIDEVLRTRAPFSVQESIESVALQALPSVEARELLHVLAPQTSVTVPLLADDRVTGVLTLCRGPDRPPIDDQELSVVVALGRRAGLAIENARLYAEQAAASAHDRTVAQALQQALLTTLPRPDHLQLAARYRPAADGDQVGGDWYDALVGRDGVTTVMIGDVVGHDIAAAALMGQLRTMLRMLARRQDELPSTILRGLDRAADDLQVDALATVLTARIEPTSGDGRAGPRLRWSNAGHPPPVLVRSDGTVSLLAGEETDLMVGVLPEVARTDHSCVLPPDATLLFYTDGLVERRDEDLDTGMARLMDSLRRHHRLEPEDLLEEVLADTIGHQQYDDTAVLVVRLSHELPDG